MRECEALTEDIQAGTLVQKHAWKQEDTPGELRWVQTLIPGISPNMIAVEGEAEEPGEPSARKRVCQVRRGAAGNVLRRVTR